MQSGEGGLMIKWLLIFAIFAVLVIELADSQIQQETDGIKSSGLKENQTYDIKLEPIENVIPSGGVQNTDNVIIKPRSNTEIYLSLGVLAFGVILILFTGFVALKKNSGWDQEATRIFAVSVIVTAGLFLITAGYSDQQIAPMFGLLGTIVGYLLGKSPSGEQGPKSGT
jgi:hypothetical protein